MKKEQRLVESLQELANEKAALEQIIESLPRGYISVKTISGHKYNYRQWREGEKIVSSYVPDAFLNSVKRKIAIRKENEQTLKAVKKEIKSISHKILKNGLLSEEEIAKIIENAK